MPAAADREGNTGFYFARSNPTTTRLFSSAIEYHAQHRNLDDQTSFFRVLKVGTVAANAHPYVTSEITLPAAYLAPDPRFLKAWHENGSAELCRYAETEGGKYDRGSPRRCSPDQLGGCPQRDCPLPACGVPSGFALRSSDGFDEEYAHLMDELNMSPVLLHLNCGLHQTLEVKVLSPFTSISCSPNYIECHHHASTVKELTYCSSLEQNCAYGRCWSVAAGQ